MLLSANNSNTYNFKISRAELIATLKLINSPDRLVSRTTLPTAAKRITECYADFGPHYHRRKLRLVGSD